MLILNEIMKSYTDENGAVTKFEYDDAGRVTKRIWADGSAVEDKYENGRLRLRLEAGRITRYEYDLMGRPVKTDIRQADVGGTSKTSVMKFEYNDNWQLVKASGSDVTVEFNYDKFGRVVSEKSGTGTVESVYNSRGLLAEKICKINGQTQSFTTKYFYDQFYRITRIVSPAGEYNYEYDKKGYVSSLKGPGYVENRAYDKGGRLVSKTLNGKLFCAYEYDNMNRRTKADINGIKWEYKYDEFGQLVSAKSSDGKSYDYSYDKIGNGLAFRGNAYAFNKLNQFADPGFKYDEYGNMTAAPDGWKYTWDTQNRLMKAEKGDKKLEFAYDFMSRRTGRKVFESGKLTADEKFVFDGYNMTLKYDVLKGMASLTHFAWNGQELLSMADASGKALSYIKDGNKNVLQLVSKNGAVTAQYAYSPFGEPISAPAKDNDNPYRFSSEQWDEILNMVYYNYRYYSPSHGRWLSKDPIEEQGGMNTYVFVLNNPVDMFDTKGLWMTSDHRRLTRDSLNAYWLTIKEASRPTAACRNRVSTELVAANASQDSGVSAQDFRRHFNRTYVSNETAAARATDRITMRSAFQNYLLIEVTAFKEETECWSKLQALGFLTHSWQDYYGHGIVAATAGGNGTFTDPIPGNPDAISSNVYPSSYNSWHGVYSGEHPNWAEPVATSSARFSQAEAFVSRKFLTYMKEWLDDCKCKCEKDTRTK